MIILGLGSNVGDKLANLRAALSAIKQVATLKIQQVSPLYISDAVLPDNAPADWDMPYLNLTIEIETSLTPHELLKHLKVIERKIGRKPEVRHWGPRVIDIDILAWDEKIIHDDVLTIPHENLQERPFALWPLADIAPLWIFPLPGINQGKTAAEIVEPWASRFSGDAPCHTRQINQRIDTPHLVGVVNVTPDSFSDGGAFLLAEKALQQSIHQVYAGADIIDIGAESTAPNREPVDPKIEWERLEPVLSAIHSSKKHFLIPPKISIDTRHAFVAAKAIKLGIDILNDVSGLDDPAMRAIVKEAGIDCVVMHHHALPERRDQHLPRDQDPVKAVLAWGEKRIAELIDYGIPKEKIIFDPGIGFGKLAEQSMVLLKNIHTFKSLGTRLLVGHSRKTFLSILSGLSFAERDIETMVMALYLAREHVDYLRVHNVEFCARGLRVMKALAN